MAELSGQMQLPGTQWFKGDFRRNQPLADAAKGFAQSRGRNYQHGPDDIASVRADPNEIADLGRTVEKQADTRVPNTPEQDASYKSLHSDIEDQYDYMTRSKDQGGLGINVEVTSDDPYPTPMAMRDDFEANNRLKVYSTANTPTYDNPSMPPEINDKFRAVHDTFGHLATGRNFSRHGETGAFEHHRQMFSDESLPAMTSELKAQSAALYWKGDFQENKPYSLTDDQVSRGAFNSPAASKNTSRAANRSQQLSMRFR